MDQYLATTIRSYRNIRMRNIPLVATRDAVLGRWWNQFRFGRAFVVGATWRAIHDRLLPAYAETMGVTTENLREY